MNTFQHIRGISPIKEKFLWENGILTWENYLQSNQNWFHKSLQNAVGWELKQSITSLDANDFYYFFQKLPAKEHWRMIPHLHQKSAFFDIETTGNLTVGNHITTICLFDGVNLYSYVRGDNLYQFAEDIQKYEMVVTYNGKSFDVPFIEWEFGMKLNKIHLDLMHPLRALGIRGGLKNCEKKVGIHRGDLLDVDGYDAVLLWDAFQKTQQRKYLETLLAYNALDSINLQKLMHIVYERHSKLLPFQVEPLDRTNDFDLPFMPDVSAIRAIKQNRDELDWRIGR